MSKKGEAMKTDWEKTFDAELAFIYENQPVGVELLIHLGNAVAANKLAIAEILNRPLSERLVQL